MKKKLLAVLLAVCMVASLMLMPAAAADEGTFTDVAEDHWASESIERWAGYGVLNGTDAEAGTFNPEGSMTRAAFAKVVVELLGLPTEGLDMPFEDVAGTSNDWATDYIAAAYNAGIVNGTNTAGTRFAPGNSVSFDQSAAMLSRALGLVEKDAYGDEVTTVLADLDMLDALDDFVSGETEMNRAAVAALADNMIGVYVTPGTIDEVTEDGVISGEYSGIILVVASEGIAVELKDVTTTAPIVLQGGNVTLTGTTAPNVKVSGGNAILVVDEDSTVGSVTVDGTNANLRVDGTVESVTVTETATISHLEGEGVSAENVTNNSPVDITVNGETVAATPVEEPDDTEEPENPDEETPDENAGEGFVPAPSAPTTIPDVVTGDDIPDGKVSVDPEADESKAVAETVTDPETGATTTTKMCDSGEHKWVKQSSSEAATCEAAGHVDYKCSVCNATITQSIPSLGGHVWYVSNNTEGAPTCTSSGHYTETCATCSTTRTVDLPALGHTMVTHAATGTHTAGIWCSVCETWLSGSVIEPDEDDDDTPSTPPTDEPTKDPENSKDPEEP